MVCSPPLIKSASFGHYGGSGPPARFTLLFHGMEIDRFFDRPMIMSVSERQLIKACKDGEDSAFEELVNRYKMKAYSLAYFLLGNVDDALDISQEAFIKIYRNINRFRGESSFGTWLHKITYNLCMDFLRSRKRMTTLPYEDEIQVSKEELAMQSSKVSSPLGILLKREAKKRIWAAINKLPPKLKSVVVLREIQGLSYSEIAQVVGCSGGTVMSRLYHARKRLRKKLKPGLNTS